MSVTATLCRLKAWKTSLTFATVVPLGIGETSTNLDMINIISKKLKYCHIKEGKILYSNASANKMRKVFP